MKFIGILLLLVAVVAMEASPQGGDNSLEPKSNLFLQAPAAYACKVDNDCPQGYGCKCDTFHKVCVHCQECSSDQYCRDKHNNPESGCKCSNNLCVGCVQSS